MKFKAMVCISGLMANPMKVNGSTTRCTVMDILFGQMANSIREALKKISVMDKANLFGKMAVSMMVAG